MDEADDQLLTLDQVAERLKVSVETVRKLCVTGKLAWINVGTGESRHLRRVRQATLTAYLRNERQNDTARQLRNIRETHEAMRLVEQRW